MKNKMSSQTPSGDAIFTPEFIQARTTVYMAKGLRITPFLNQDKVSSRSNYTFFSEKSTPAADLADGTTAAPERVAPGADLTTVRTTDMKADSVPVEVRGYKLVVEDQKLKENPNYFIRYLQRLAFGIGRGVEADAYNVLSADAAATAATLSNGVWSASNGISKDVIRMQAAFQDDSLPDRLTGLFYESGNHVELKEYLDAIGPNSEVIYNNQDDILFKGTRHIYGGETGVHGTAIGFDLDNPPATVAYGMVDGAYNPDVLEGMEGYKPLINVKVTPEEGLYPKTIIEMASETAVVSELPKGILKQTGL